MKNAIKIVLLISLTVVFVCGSARNTYTKQKSQWKYIVIHHSGTAIGNTKRFDKYHKEVRHMENGVAYHYVICNGSCGCKDGHIEITRRWEKQLPGGHCRSEINNQISIGICIVGNFQKTRPSEKQFWSLVWLIKKLMQEYNIPIRNVRGHKNMQGENTLCPGKYFPWRRLNKEVRKKKKLSFN